MSLTENIFKIFSIENLEGDMRLMFDLWTEVQVMMMG